MSELSPTFQIISRNITTVAVLILFLSMATLAPANCSAIPLSINEVVNVAAKSKAVFKLTYEELLRRKLGLYELAISVRPQDKLLTNTLEGEILGWLWEKLPPLPSTVVHKNETTASITFTPTREEQDILADSSGNFGDFVILYDVGRSGEIGGYFVHYFAPKGLTALPKNIIFVIDVSGSMTGTKIKQTRNAMLQTLGDLNDNDYFNILTFSGGVDAWKNEGLISAKAENLEKAKEFVRRMQAHGSTNINSAILTAVEHLQSHQSNVVSTSLIVLLTDGDPTEGETNTDKIMANSRKAIDGKYSLFCLGFGHDVDFKFLKKLSLHNGGFARKIFEDVDADLQLKNFYSEIGTPLLSELQLKYPDNKVSKTTKNMFKNYFNGSEIIVAGKLEEEENNVMEVTIDCFGSLHRILLNDTISIRPPRPKKSPPSFTERLWAYLTIKELLQQKLLADDLSRKTNISNQALSLSLRYNFVTPLTSMVVTVPEESEEVKPGEPPILPMRIEHLVSLRWWDKAFVTHFVGSVQLCLGGVRAVSCHVYAVSCLCLSHAMLRIVHAASCPCPCRVCVVSCHIYAGVNLSINAKSLINQQLNRKAKPINLQ
uniref:Inter-alpha-trypsin inhibitor heavy chain 4 n=1 Tax=Eptatretus burgeri TaxID=7764 RepID=A0A8C4QH61_EPTBU